MADPIKVIVEDDDDSVRIDRETGNIETDTPDGGVVVQFGAAKKQPDEDTDFYKNLADDVDGGKMALLANELIDAIQSDDRSRGEYLQIRARGMDLLGIKLQEPKSTVGDSAAITEGMSSVTNPLLLDACLRGWANAQAELLPANGPMKIRDDGDETTAEDELAESLERDMNHYLTKVATEYYPDTSHMLLWGVYFGGSGFKKVYRCPMRRRPVSESVDAKDLIVSDTTKDLRSCGRITHQISMRPSVMKRMKYLGAYRNVALGQPAPPAPGPVDAKIAGIQGTQPTQDRPEDQPYTLWETQCELDLPDFAPPQFKDEGIPLPYLVTIDKDSREILSIRRDWNEDDDLCERRRMYIRYPYVPGPGFYGTGMLNILGNCSAAMTAAWRESLDAGMFASFPGGFIAKLGSRQNTSDFRMAPGQFPAIETNGMPIGNVIMGSPYKDVTPGLMALIDKITSQAKALGGAADIPAAEGIQNVPVGTMLAQIEQATKVMAAAHKGMHQAQSEEFDLIVDLFKENPEDFLRQCGSDWTKENFLQALNDCSLVPVSDPNVPSHIHRVAKAVALAQLKDSPSFGPIMDATETLKRILSAMREDPQGLITPPPPQAAQPDLAGQAKIISAIAQKDKVQQQAADTAQTNQSKERIAALNVVKEGIIHNDEQANIKADQALAGSQHNLETAKAVHDANMDVAQNANSGISNPQGPQNAPAQ